MAISAEKIRELIKKKFPQADIEIVDTAGDSNHYSATITAQEFKGLSRVEQHKLVYKALEGAMDGTNGICLLYTSPSPRDRLLSRMPSSA